MNDRNARKTPDTSETIWDQIQEAITEVVPQTFSSSVGKSRQGNKNPEWTIRIILHQLFNRIKEDIFRVNLLPMEDDFGIEIKDYETDENAPFSEDEGFETRLAEWSNKSGYNDACTQLKRKNIETLIEIFYEKMQALIRGETPVELHAVTHLTVPIEEVSWTVSDGPNLPAQQRNVQYYMNLILEKLQKAHISYSC